jgi:hypothetical protein
VIRICELSAAMGEFSSPLPQINRIQNFHQAIAYYGWRSSTASKTQEGINHASLLDVCRPAIVFDYFDRRRATGYLARFSA